MTVHKSKQTISVSEDRVTEAHSLRRGTLPKSADASLVDRNLYPYAPDKTYREQFNDYFKPYIDAYNAKQKRKDRRWDYDYFQKLTDGGQVEPINSFVIQIGSRDSTCGITDPTFDAKHWRELRDTQGPDAASAYVAEHINTHPNVQTCATILEDVASQIRDWYPNFVPVSIAIHMDEPSGTPHMDVNGIWVATRNKRGLEKRCAKEAALKEMGFDGKAYGSPFKDWQQDCLRRVSDVARQYGIEREIAGSTGPHTSVAAYRIEQERQDEADKLREIKRRQEVARVTLEKMTMDIETAKHRKRTVEADELAAKERARKAADEARESEKKARQAEAQATEAETRQRIADAAVVAARKRQEDAERELKRNAERYKTARAKTDEAEEQAQVAEGKLSQLTEWIHRLSDIKGLVTTVLSGVVSYIDTVHTEDAKVASRFMRTHATGIISYTAKAVKLKVEEIVTGKKIVDDSKKNEPVRTIRIPTNTRRPSQDTPTV